jgi:hypothetical protein
VNSKRRILAILAYALLTSILVAYHEPWRDEVDAWLTARDETPLAVFRLAGYSGTPALWYLLQMPFAKLGLPIAMQGILNLFIAVSAGTVILWCAPLPFYLCLAWLFSYYMSFEYAVIARSYALGILLILSAAALTKRRWERPISYGVVLALLGNVSAHFFLVAGVFWVLWTAEITMAWLNPDRTKKKVPQILANWTVGSIIAAFGLAFVFWQLLPASDGQFAPKVIGQTEWKYFIVAPYRALLFRGHAFWHLPLVLVAYGATAVWLATRRRALAFFLCSYAGLSYIFVFKYVGGTWHFGLHLTILMVTHWLGADEPPRKPLFRLRNSWCCSARPIAIGSITLALVASLVMGGRIWAQEIREPFSEAQRMGDFIKTVGYADRTIAAHPAVYGMAVLGFLPVRRFYYPALGAYGSHMPWNHLFSETRLMSLNAAITITQRAFPDWRDETGRAVLLLTSEVLKEPYAQDFKLLYQTPGSSWSKKEEKYYLYAPRGRGGLP